MTFILDTDHLTLLERGGSGALALEMRLDQLPERNLATTIITYEEQMLGWMSLVAKARTPSSLIRAYARLQEQIGTFRDAPIVAYDELAAGDFERLRQARVRIGAKNLRIAAICLANDATLLTRNIKDFSKVPGLRAEDWSA